MNNKSLFCAIIIWIFVIAAACDEINGKPPTTMLLLAILFAVFKVDFDQDGV